MMVQESSKVRDCLSLASSNRAESFSVWFLVGPPLGPPTTLPQFVLSQVLVFPGRTGPGNRTGTGNRMRGSGSRALELAPV